MTPKQTSERRADLAAAHNDFNKSLNSYAYFKVNDHSKGEDLVQDTFIKTWSYLVKGGKIDAMKSFLYHILNNLIIDEYRKRKQKTSSLDTMMEDDGFEPADESIRDFADVPAAREAVKLLDELDEIYRTAITMRYMDEMSPREIADALGVSENVVSVRIHRGIEKLSKLAKREPERP